jgi:hypothetical protein
MGFPFTKKKKVKEPTELAVEPAPIPLTTTTSTLVTNDTTTTTSTAAIVEPATVKPVTTKPPIAKPASTKTVTAKTPPRNSKSKKSDAAAGTGSSSRRGMLFGKPSPFRKRAPETPQTEPEMTPRSVLEDINVKAASGNDFEVFMGDYPEEVVAEREMIRKQLFGGEGEQGDKTPSSLHRATTTNSQEVSPDGKVRNADDVSVEVVPVIKAPADSEAPLAGDEVIQEEKNEKTVPTPVPKIQRVRTAAEIAAVAQAIYAAAAIPPSPTAQARGPKTPMAEGKPFDEEIEYNKDEMEEMEQFAEKEADRKMEEQARLRDQDTFSTTDSTARDYDPSVSSSFHPRNNSLMMSPSGRSYVSSASVFSTSENKTRAGKIMDALGCGKDTTIAGYSVANMFYDTANACDPQAKEPVSRRPYYNEAFAKQFLRKLLTKGINVLYLQPPLAPGNDSPDWKGRTVTLLIEPGMAGSESAIQPTLEWSTLAGGRNFEVDTASLALLRIVSITGSAQEMMEEGDDDKDLCFFTITSDTGDVHIFEGSSPEERDEIVNGLKNVIARLTFHLIAGDTTASSELYAENANSQSASVEDQPGLVNPKQAMNRIAHTLL